MKYTTNIHDDTYSSLIKYVLLNGSLREDRTKTGTISCFSPPDMIYDLEQGFPLITTKKMFWKGIVHEVLWYLSGSTNIEYLKKHNINIWDEWADDKGEVGKIYGYQWTRWEKFATDVFGENISVSINQIEKVISEIQTNPYSRRLIVTAWNVSDLEEVNLPPCHILFQFYVDNKNRLSCKLTQRSADVMLGVPFNIAGYSLLTHMVASVCGLQVGKFIHSIGDAHIYLNHIDAAKEQIERLSFASPTLNINSEIKDIFKYAYEDILLENYTAHPNFKLDVAV